MQSHWECDHIVTSSRAEWLTFYLWSGTQAYTIHTSIECCSRLVDTLEVFLERNGLPEIKHFRDEFPDSITLAQSVAVWKHIVSE